MKTSLLVMVLIPLSISVAMAQGSLQPEAWDAQMKLVEAVDINPDPHIVEVELEAKVARVSVADKPVDAWTYNGGIPGPLIRTHIGDRLIVHFRNNLPQPTTVHWHGVRLPIEMDGVPGVSQPEVTTGSSFTYDFRVPDAGLFWYHPHVMSALQVGFGLYGALLVEDPAEKIGVDDELVMVLSDIAIEESGALQSPDDAGVARLVFGLEGNHVMVNGRTRPKMIARAGAPQRWRIVNAAKTRYFAMQLDIDGKSGGLFTVIGRDGGLQEYPGKPEDVIVVAPGERVDVLIAPTAAPGSEIVVRSVPHNRGYGSEFLPVEDLFTIALSNSPAYTNASVPAIHRTIEPLDRTKAVPVNIDISLFQVNDRTIEYRLNDTPPALLKPIKASPGETQIWTVTNPTKWSHPIHLHGFFFQVLDDNGEPVHPIAWRDTVDVPFDKTMRFIVRYDDRQGAWMFHCHVLDHAEGGLMGMVEVGTPAAGHSNHVHSNPD